MGDLAVWPAASDALQGLRELRLPPGARLSEQEVATHFGVSRQPVREALIRLENSALIKINRNGTAVTRISAKEMIERLFLRQAVEMAIVAKAAHNFGRWQRELIARLLINQEEAADALDHATFGKADEDFHIAIASGVGMEIAGTVIADSKAHMDRLRNIRPSSTADLKRVVREHRAIIAAIDVHDVCGAQDAMAKHLEGILCDLAEVATRHTNFSSSLDSLRMHACCEREQ